MLELEYLLKKKNPNLIAQHQLCLQRKVYKYLIVSNMLKLLWGKGCRSGKQQPNYTSMEEEVPITRWLLPCPGRHGRPQKALCTHGRGHYQRPTSDWRTRKSGHPGGATWALGIAHGQDLPGQLGTLMSNPCLCRSHLSMLWRYLSKCDAAFQNEHHCSSVQGGEDPPFSIAGHV